MHKAAREVWENELRRTTQRIDNLIRMHCYAGVVVTQLYSKELRQLAEKAGNLKGKLNERHGS